MTDLEIIGTFAIRHGFQLSARHRELYINAIMRELYPDAGLPISPAEVVFAAESLKIRALAGILRPEVEDWKPQPVSNPEKLSGIVWG